MVLDRDEDAALAEIEAALRRDDPAFVLLLERIERDPLGIADAAQAFEDLEPPTVTPPQPSVYVGVYPVDEPSRARRLVRLLSVLLAAGLAFVVTLAVTAAWGPDAGGLVGVLAIMAATMYGYQLLRGCPGRR